MAFSDWYWVIWLGVGFLAFELYAHFFTPEKKDTLSQWVWDVFAVARPNRRFGRLRRGILLGLVLTLSAHFIYMTPVGLVVVFMVGTAWSIYYTLRHER